ncbi:hypothetical protein Salat_1135900 [Sesamum alatum]|uniref:Uncharacterized protein n=1 Tax=Sesamum alatum TaxID=300844 RepID=A0AAE1YE11_9LAMI|nr:hypothetical protein Salat_1135900 [Sesamum alatum]
MAMCTHRHQLHVHAPNVQAAGACAQLNSPLPLPPPLSKLAAAVQVRQPSPLSKFATATALQAPPRFASAKRRRCSASAKHCPNPRCRYSAYAKHCPNLRRRRQDPPRFAPPPPSSAVDPPRPEAPSRSLCVLKRHRAPSVA